MKIEIIKCLQDNYSYLIIDKKSNEACVIDPSEADPVIEKKKILVVPDILANSGGVCISYLEWVQNNMGYYWSFDEVASKMEKNITQGFKGKGDSK